MPRLSLLTFLVVLFAFTLPAAAQQSTPPAAAAAPAKPVSKSTPPDQIKVPAGFKVELLHSATEAEGSWISMAVDDKGRLYISPQSMTPQGGILRVTLDDAGRVAKKEWLAPKVGVAMGMLWAFDSLYVNGQGPDGQAIYRLRDTNGDDQLDEAKLFKKVPGGAGEHGAHAMVVGPDNKIYIAHGNSTPLVEGVASDSPYRHWREDFLLPRIMDPVATFFDNLKVPYGHVLRTDADGTTWELFAGGFRNQYDIDFNADGELFTFDSDMEWDIGLPWYRPTRVMHVTSGAEFGFREGSTKWPEYYSDSLPAVADIGLSSPTGVKFGTKSRFPDRYKRALFVMDWTFGRILAVHMKPDGSTYTAKNPLPNPYYLSAPTAGGDVEEFLAGKGMPVADLEFGKDGAMYFVVGGRGTQSGLYRVSHDGNAMQLAERMRDAGLRARRALEAFHGNDDPKAVAAAWPALGDADRFLRYAARIAVESQPVAQWQEKALGEQNPRAAMAALLALVRVGPTDAQPAILKRLGAFPLDALPDDLKLEKLRVIQLSFIRQGRPSDEMVKTAIEKLSAQYPAKSFAMNRELSQLLVWLGAEDVVGKTLKLMDAASDPAEQIWYAYVLREARAWTPAQREAYFSWFGRAASFKGGNSFPKFILKIRDEAMAKVPEAERPAVAAILKRKPRVAATNAPAARPAVARKFQKQWTTADLAGDLNAVGAGRNFERGWEIFASQQCLTCHRFGNEGGGVGPDITAVSNRFSRLDLLVSILEPSKAISEQYAGYVITDNKGKRHFGQIAEENNDLTTLITDPLTDTRERIPRAWITAKRMSPVSTMPTGLLDVLTKDEVYDLLAYIEAGGKAESPQFRAKQ